jgi:hypothetical protein
MPRFRDGRCFLFLVVNLASPMWPDGLQRLRNSNVAMSEVSQIGSRRRIVPVVTATELDKGQRPMTLISSQERQM